MLINTAKRIGYIIIIKSRSQITTCYSNPDAIDRCNYTLKINQRQFIKENTEF